MNWRRPSRTSSSQICKFLNFINLFELNLKYLYHQSEVEAKTYYLFESSLPISNQDPCCEPKRSQFQVEHGIKTPFCYNIHYKFMNNECTI